MNSEGGTKSYKSPLAGRTSSAAASDDEISVIAVIKKGTSGIPKRARYHYIRELPLASVKSLKKSLEKSKDRRAHHHQVKVLVPEIEASSCSSSASSSRPSSARSSKDKIKSLNNVKKPRVIELSDEVSKMELRKQFKISDKINEDKESPNSAGGKPRSSSNCTSEGSNMVHKLPPGTVLIKQEQKTPRNSTTSGKNQSSGNNNNGSSAGATTTTATSNSTSSNSSSVSSSGNGSSSGGFGSVSASSNKKVKRLHRGQKIGNRKKTVDHVVPRRNPKRCGAGSKKNATVMIREAVAPTSTTTTRPRQRQRLLTTRIQDSVEILTNRRTKPATMPYMNTRSVTRKLYTVGATYQAPTRKDETEWRDWPVHGMHERPVFHPQIGLAAGYAGRVFWTTTDDDGSNWTYREVLDASEEVEVVPVDPRPKRTPSPNGTGEESFEVCMHQSLHSVLAYCAQVMAPDYHRVVVKKRRHEVEDDSEFPVENKAEKEVAEVEKFESETTELNLTELEDSSISDETLMEMSSIYKKLLPIEDQPSSRENSPSATADRSPSLSNNFIGDKKIAEDGLTVSNNPNEASEIARILSEYNESLKEKGYSHPSDSTNPVTASIPDNIATDYVSEKVDSKVPEVKEKISTTMRTIDVDQSSAGSTNVSILDNEALKLTPEKSMSNDHWLENLLVDTSLLYCVATGVGQRDLTQYVDSLDGKQSLQWLRRRDG